MIILFTGVIFPDYLISKIISDYLSIAFWEKLMITVAKHVIILVIIRSLATPYTGPHKLFKDGRDTKAKKSFKGCAKLQSL